MDELYRVVAGAVVVLGMLIPALMYLANRNLRENDDKIQKLFSICDKNRDCMLEKAIQIAKLEEAIERLDRLAERCNR
jgi:hypothetical protein